MGWAERRNPRSKYNRKRGLKLEKMKSGHEPHVVVNINFLQKLREIYANIHRKVKGNTVASN